MLKMPAAMICSLYRGLIDAKLLTYEQVNFGYISGSVEFGPDGKGINQDAKYNQWDFQQKQLPTYAGSEFNGSRGGAINSMKLIAAVANASPVTGGYCSERNLFSARSQLFKR